MICVLAFGFLSACAERNFDGPNVLILSLESVRGDRLGVAGYSRQITPNIDALAARGAHFTRAYAQGSWTRPSIASTFSSAYQSTHRVVGEPYPGMPYHEMEDTSGLSKLSDNFETLAEVFQAAGYRTFGWTSNAQISTVLGFSQGFDEYRALDVDDATLLQRVTEVFSTSQRPFLVYAHFMKAHYPYLPDERFNRFDGGAEGVAITSENYLAINEGQIPLTQADVEYNIDLYDGAIAQVDDMVGRVLEALADAGLQDETIVVIMADHGDELYEHGVVGHSFSLRESLIHTPLVIAGPGVVEGQVVDAPVQYIDIMPTLASMILGSVPPGTQGRDLSGVLGGAEQPVVRPVFSENGRQRAVIDGDWKYVVHFGTPFFEALYNVADDPSERINLIEQPDRQGERQRLRALIDELIAHNEELAVIYESGAFVEAPPEVLERLRALGYIR